MYSSGTVHYETFRRGSRTYFNSSRFFPEDVRTDVYTLYGFVRTADNFVDTVPQQRAEFENFVGRYEKSIRSGDASGDAIIDSFVELARRKQFERSWIDAFLHSMELDLEKSRHVTLEESLEYIYGSAEVIGLFMVRILGLDERAGHAARMLGRAMQYINFIRDIDEDNRFGRIYLPISESDLESLDEQYIRAPPGGVCLLHSRPITAIHGVAGRGGEGVLPHTPQISRPHKDGRRHVQMDGSPNRQ